MNFYYIEPRLNMQVKDGVIISPFEKMMYQGLGDNGVDYKKGLSDDIKFSKLFPSIETVRNHINSFEYYLNSNQCYKKFINYPFERRVTIPKLFYHCLSISIVVNEEFLDLLKNLLGFTDSNFIEIPTKNIKHYNFDYSLNGFKESIWEGSKEYYPVIKHFTKKRGYGPVDTEIYDGSIIKKYYKNYKEKVDSRMFLCIFEDYGQQTSCTTDSTKNEILNSELYKSGNWELRTISTDRCDDIQVLLPQNNKNYINKCLLGIIMSDSIYEKLKWDFPNFFFKIIMI